MRTCRMCSKKLTLCACQRTLPKKATRRQKKKEDVQGQTRLSWNGSPREQLTHWRNRRPVVEGNNPAPLSSPPTASAVEEENPTNSRQIWIQPWDKFLDPRCR